MCDKRFTRTKKLSLAKRERIRDNCYRQAYTYKERNIDKCVSCDYVAYHKYADLLLACDFADEDCKAAAEAELEIMLTKCCEMKETKLFKFDVK